MFVCDRRKPSSLCRHRRHDERNSENNTATSATSATTAMKTPVREPRVHPIAITIVVKVRRRRRKPMITTEPEEAPVEPLSL